MSKRQSVTFSDRAMAELRGKRQSVTFSDRAMAELREEAKQVSITVSDLLRRIVDHWLERPRYQRVPMALDPRAITNIQPSDSPLLRQATKKADNK
jgi:hypothetical protein